ncbi:MAG: thiamine phosphate synthase [Syntrophorhabdaceae bacterium]|nr:thiamine phosphate synthase [Syntrophorhabdaceae bacterium]
MKKPTLNDYRLYLVTDPRLHRGYTVLEQVGLALRGGVKIIQLREKEMPAPDYIRLASEALKLTRPHGSFLIINDSVEVAKATGADGLHLGQEDAPVAEARKILGQDIIIGISVKTVGEAVRAEKDGADYLAVSGVFPTSTKKDLGHYPGLDGVRQIRQNTRLPVIGIGGINPGNCRSVIEAGAHGVAVVTAITMSEDIPGTCRAFLELIAKHP